MDLSCEQMWQYFPIWKHYNFRGIKLIYADVEDIVQEQEYLFTNLHLSHLKLILTDFPAVLKIGEHEFLKNINIGGNIQHISFYQF
jgi:hypothetical protein